MTDKNNWYYRKHIGYEIKEPEKIERQVKSGEGMPTLHQSRTGIPRINLELIK